VDDVDDDVIGDVDDDVIDDVDDDVIDDDVIDDVDDDVIDDVDVVDDVIDDVDVVDDINDDVDDDVIEGECELRWHWQKLEYAVSKMIICMKLSMIIVLIMDDGVRDDVDDDVIDDVDDVDDDVIEGECELRWHWQKLEEVLSFASANLGKTVAYSCGTFFLDRWLNKSTRAVVSPKGQLRLQNPPGFLDDYIAIIQAYIPLIPTELIFNLDEIGLSDWEERKVKPVIVPSEAT
jgi:hypothetical protein